LTKGSHFSKPSTEKVEGFFLEKWRAREEKKGVDKGKVLHFPLILLLPAEGRKILKRNHQGFLLKRSKRLAQRRPRGEQEKRSAESEQGVERWAFYFICLGQAVAV
jgi:hypothetical protein